MRNLSIDDLYGFEDICENELLFCVEGGCSVNQSPSDMSDPTGSKVGEALQQQRQQIENGLGQQKPVSENDIDVAYTGPSSVVGGYNYSSSK